ncbi:MAG: radical SAM protein [Deltaproteobacteria bacterium]|nr:radical SAM protein [Deltaproteobacteria bacterium]
MINLRRNTLLFRILRLAWREPWIVPAFLRYEYRGRWGARWDRLRHSGRSALPAYVGLNVTRRCNLRCLMCNQYRAPEAKPGKNISWYDPSRELPLDAWVSLLDELAVWRPILYVTGGEPLLYPRILDLLAAAKARGLAVQLQTNGVLLDRVAADLVDLGVQMVTISLDGSPEINDQIRGPMAFARTAAGVQALSAARERRGSPTPIMDLLGTISRANLAHLGELVPIALEMGVDKLNFNHTDFLNREMADRHNLMLSADFAQSQGLSLIPPSLPRGEYYESKIAAADVPVLMESIREVNRRAKGRIPVMFFPNLPDAVLGPYYLDLDYAFPQVCRHLWQKVRIMPDGTVSPCLHLVMGNIVHEPLREIWNNSPYRNFRRLAAKRLFPGCARCCHRRFS